MVAASITCLLLLAGYLAKRWNDASNEAALLRGQVSNLKKRLAQR